MMELGGDVWETYSPVIPVFVVTLIAKSGRSRVAPGRYVAWEASGAGPMFSSGKVNWVSSMFVSSSGIVMCDSRRWYSFWLIPRGSGDWFGCSSVVVDGEIECGFGWFWIRSGSRGG